jgi:hypothetical protein
MSKQFTHRNEGFICGNCGATVPDAQGTCRNHCTQCLCSLHVDVFPGDRASTCAGKMRPVDVFLQRGSLAGLVHECETCGYTGRNKLAPDDDRDAVMAVMASAATAKMKKR